MSKTYIKYAAVASAVAVACGAISASAATLTPGTTVQTTLQKNAASPGTTDTVPSPFTLALAASYAVNDTAVLTLAGASLRTTTAPANVECNGAAAGNSLILAGISKTSSTATYRVLTVSGAAVTSYSCAFAAANFSFIVNSAQTLGASSITLAYQGYIGGNSSSPFDAGAKVELGGVVNQFTASLNSGDGFSGTIDVNYDRKTWTQGNSRSLTLSLTSVALGATSAETTLSAVITGTGDAMFSFLDDDGDGCTASDLTAGAGTASTSGTSSATGSLSISANCATLTWSGSPAVGSASAGSQVTIVLTKSSGTSGLAIANGTFSVAPTFTVSVTSGTASTQGITAFSGGSFSLNGTTITIPYTPYGSSGGSAITQSYYITNDSSTSGTVTGTAFAKKWVGGVEQSTTTTCSLGTVGTATAKSVTNLSTGINDKINACFKDTGTVAADGTRVYIQLIANTPAATTHLNSTYNVGGSSRVNTINDSTKVRTQ